MNYEKITGGVCAAIGYQANGLNCGLNSDKNKNDLALVFSEAPAKTAAVYTRNKFKAAPLRVTQQNLAASGQITRAIIANSKNANCGNADGEQVAAQECKLVAEALGIEENEVIVASTGVIGQPMPIEPIETHMAELVSGLSADRNDRAVNAIMTTDTVPKESAVAFEIGGKTCHLGGMSKGSGMIHPNMATTLTFITSDVAISQELLQKALSEVVKVTYNCLSIDGDTSTNDMAVVLANGCAGNIEITEYGVENTGHADDSAVCSEADGRFTNDTAFTEESEDNREDRRIEENSNYEIFKEALRIVMTDLVRMLAKDGEGATKLLECECSGAPDQEMAIIIAKSIIRSPLFKCAMFGEDANYGRILCAIGYAEADFDIAKVDVDLASAKGRIAVCRSGFGVPFSEEEAKEILGEDEILIYVNLNQGEASAKAWGCDLTYDYVKINGDYRS